MPVYRSASRIALAAALILASAACHSRDAASAPIESDVRMRLTRIEFDHQVEEIVISGALLLRAGAEAPDTVWIAPIITHRSAGSDGRVHANAIPVVNPFAAGDSTEFAVRGPMHIPDGYDRMSLNDLITVRVSAVSAADAEAWKPADGDGESALPR